MVLARFKVLSVLGFAKMSKFSLVLGMAAIFCPSSYAAPASLSCMPPGRKVEWTAGRSKSLH